jgi:glucokinase
MYLFGVDIGGTKCRVSLGEDRDGELRFISLGKERATREQGPDEMLKLLLGDAESLAKDAGERPAAIGISCGGPLDRKRGIILSPPNLPGWDRIGITGYFQVAMGIPAFLRNDADAGALAEWKYGAGKGCDSLIFITCGTGFGAGLILNSRLYSGASDMAGEIGHLRLADYGPPGYGKTGSFEGFCSGGGIARLARDMAEAELQQGRSPSICPGYGDLKNLSAKSVGIAAEKGDPLARQIYAEAGRRLGQGLSIVIDMLNPEMIVIGSIFARSRNELWPYAEEVIKRETLSGSREACRVVPGILGEEIGNYAAVTAAKYGLETTVAKGRIRTLHPPGGV